MKKLIFLFLSLLVAGSAFQSCSKSKTYAEQLKEEKEAIQNFIDDNRITVIDVAQFHAQDSTTNLDNNEYVFFPDNGVYMQVLSRGEGKMLEGDGVRTKVLCRFVQVNIFSRDTTLRNPVPGAVDEAEEMTCSKSGTTISGTFSKEYGYMSIFYGASVPNGWLIPLNYVYLGRRTSNLARVRLIVPSKQGQSEAANGVYPCYYEISYQLGF